MTEVKNGIKKASGTHHDWDAVGVYSKCRRCGCYTSRFTDGTHYGKIIRYAEWLSQAETATEDCDFELIRHLLEE